LLFWAHQSLQARRQMPVFLILALPVLADHLAGVVAQVGDWWRETRQDRRKAAAGTGAPALIGQLSSKFVCLGLLLLVGLGIVREARALPKGSLFAQSAVLSFFPQKACSFIERQGWSGRLYNEFDWGGYCIWRFYPRQQVFIDGRCEVYFDGAWENHMAIRFAQADWEERLRAAQIDTLLIRPDSYMSRMMPTSKEWKRVYNDPLALVYRRRQPFVP
jgi:hypothetical protein